MWSITFQEIGSRGVFGSANQLPKRADVVEHVQKFRWLIVDRDGMMVLDGIENITRNRGLERSECESGLVRDTLLGESRSHCNNLSK
jgi:hypothetical protein